MSTYERLKEELKNDIDVTDEQLIKWYEVNQVDIDELWTERGVETYGFDVTEWSGWDSEPDEDFIYTLYQAMKGGNYESN